MIYLDNSATTKPHEDVLKTFHTVSSKYFANPSSIHRMGGQVEDLLTKSRQQIADLLGVGSQEVVFTSGGTESNNLAIKGVAEQYKNRGKHIITTQIEHPSVLETCRHLEQMGYEITYLPVNDKGEVSVNDVKEAIRPDTILITIMHVNNEIGSVQPIEKLAEIVEQYPTVLFHVDHVQGFGKITIPYGHKGIDLITISGHKIHGLKGSACLIKKQHISLSPLQHGGAQEDRVRPGTENVANAVSLAKAIRLALEEQKNYHQLQELNQTIREELKNYLQVTINSPKHGAHHILNFSVQNFKPEVLIHAFSDEGVVVSTKSACSSRQNEASHVLKACGKTDEDASAAVRVSMNANQSQDDINAFISAFKKIMSKYEKVMG
ncbi:cysteine desulfurase family protein [Alkalibacillus haloalkaliphilus]|uniref:Aminotransferase V n=1 Tax=Alkalibacillus haloalkaliphilus TaxID=94136 RepID=A0A511W495_9BACI|nr:cysteine desulfurase family protein [Alkalibacillus haloalkaliphilus]GEN45916.1 aminotransferase V [Alkalibacillus haloalkaliphilus]